MEHFTEALKRYADFTGRTRRKGFWMFVLFYLIFYVIAAVIDGVIGTILFTSVLSLALFVPNIAITARRLHDTGRSGWMQLIALIPLIGAIVLLIFLVQDSQEGDNDYGANPKEGNIEGATA
ncbi:hypothetical protein W04_1623 [Pseudoalteromonas sp. SW0106-04]|uniref:DUF805 domain-containing protein n=1 Tax=Pseudoalteromonas sp. SW0106-04 TaxID=1702169 RepID=UPI0006B64FE7|nr:DUF805 domain-containing protein [Pseudoalteromonas sp. SW0106-04]GAP75104.1 hypothetical protein W04_1623 [Pseudoalteromonas sp. SW0106-04]